MNTPQRMRISKIALCVALAIGAVPAMAQNTTSGLGGRVTAVDGKAVTGAQVRIVHVESGSVTNTTTDAEGRYSARGLRVGGPYTITITKDGVTEKRENVFLVLAESAVLDATLGKKVEKIEVAATAISDAFSKTAMGTSTNIGRQELEAFGSINRNLQDYARNDPRLSQTDKERGEISLGGQNSRYNSVTVDGVNISDTFGLEANNLPTLKQPISIDAIQSVQVNVSNYDVTQKGYTGVNINAVTKSGTNDFKGSVYSVYRDDKIVNNQNFNRQTGVWTPRVPFEEETRGITLGGPIIKDKLFFFVAYEELTSTRAQPAFGPIGSGFVNVGIQPSAISGAQQIAQSVYRTDIGSENITAAPLSVEDLTAKIDWNISDRHRASVRYNKTEQFEPIYVAINATSLGLASNQRSEVKSIETTVAQLFSDWSDKFSTEFKVSKRDSALNHRVPSRLPQVTLSFTGALPVGAVAQAGTRSLVFGTERSRQFNQLDTKTWDAYAGGTLFLKDHEVKFGADFASNDVYNAFLQDVFGQYTFSCVNSSATYTYSFGAINCGTATADQVQAAVLENFRIGRPSFYQVQVPATGRTLNDGVARWKLDNIGAFIQDTWSVNKNLTLMFGVRLDAPKIGTKPLFNAAAAAPLVAGSGTTRNSGGFGLDNSVTIDGENLIQPRFGFNYTFDTKRPMQVRGGFGLFQGAAANVWLSNPYSNTGIATRFIGCGGSFSACPTTGGLFSMNPDAQPTLTANPPAANVDFIQKGMGQPSVWKANIAFEHQLPWWGMVASVEWLYTKTNSGIYYQHLNLGAPTRSGADGRQMYWTDQGYNPACWTATGGTITTGTCTGFRSRSLSNPNFANVLLASETKKGGGNQATVALSRPMMKGWSWSLAYTYTTSKEVNPLTSSVSNSNWLNNAVFNANEDVASNSNYLIKDRINGSLMWERAFFGKYKTRVGFFAEGRRGKPYSWVYSNDMNGDGVSGNDLMYIPRGPGSGEVVFLGDTPTSRTNEDAFWQIVNNTGIKTRGGVVSRNDSFNPWTNTLDMRVTQELPGFVKEHKSVISVDIFNVLNLMNKRWGQINEIAFPSTRNFVNYVGIDPQGRYIYALRNAGVTDFQTRQVRLESQWQMQVTFRYEF
ncbi:MAG: TonB-dependent receptor [Nitrosomonadaceae bacterium]|nr:TonB-dependent receptor [Nitrosomonadaceae bacterium]